MKGKQVKFTIRLENGNPVEVTWYPDYFEHCDHLELRGPMTETGYRSVFINKEPTTKLATEFVKDYAKAIAQKCWDENPEKFGRQAKLKI